MAQTSKSTRKDQPMSSAKKQPMLPTVDPLHPPALHTPGTYHMDVCREYNIEPEAVKSAFYYLVYTIVSTLPPRIRETSTKGYTRHTELKLIKDVMYYRNTLYGDGRTNPARRGWAYALIMYAWDVYGLVDTDAGTACGKPESERSERERDAYNDFTMHWVNAVHTIQGDTYYSSAIYMHNAYEILADAMYNAVIKWILQSKYPPVPTLPFMEACNTLLAESDSPRTRGAVTAVDAVQKAEELAERTAEAERQYRATAAANTRYLLGLLDELTALPDDSNPRSNPEADDPGGTALFRDLVASSFQSLVEHCQRVSVGYLNPTERIQEILRTYVYMHSRDITDRGLVMAVIEYGMYAYEAGGKGALPKSIAAIIEEVLANTDIYLGNRGGYGKGAAGFDLAALGDALYQVIWPWLMSGRKAPSTRAELDAIIDGIHSEARSKEAAENAARQQEYAAQAKVRAANTRYLLELLDELAVLPQDDKPRGNPTR